jgi:23S rRNA (guanosine2251-2'-O)-methyltransferase
VSPATTKVSSGATEHLPIVQVTNIVSTIKELKEAGFWVAGAAGEGSQNLYLFDFTGNNYVLVLGSEGKGIRRLVRENCDHLVSIPMMGKIESFNVSVAGAIFMSEVMRQRFFVSKPVK